MSSIVIREWHPSDSERSDRSAGDRARHRVKVRQAIRENIADIIAEEAIIGRSRDRIIKVPLKGIREYRFSFGRNQAGVGEGDGQTAPGDIIGRKSAAPGKDQAGELPGVDYYETEITLEELVEIMFEDLELPAQDRKQLREVEVDSIYRVAGYRRKGAWSQVSLRRSAIERVRRLQKSRRSLRNLEQEVQKLEQIARGAEDRGDAETARRHRKELDQKRQRLLESSEYHSQIRERKGSQLTAETPPPRFPFRDEDLRFHRRRESPRRESNAVVLCVMDTSGSMYMLKKYLARSFFFLLHSFVCTRYRNVELVFISHHVKAQEVTEEEFFHKGESGGTFISSGYNKALEIIQERYHPSLWNIYAFHCSDGDNFDSDNDHALNAAQKLCDVCNLFGYGEIKPSGSGRYENSLLNFFSQQIQSDNYEAVLIERKEDIWPALKKLLRHEVKRP